MEVRCGKCNKLFRVSDDKITGSGIKFACSQCGEYVKITRDEFEQYNLSNATASVLASYEPKPKPEPAAASPVTAQDQIDSAPVAPPAASFDLSESPTHELPSEDQVPPVFVQPEPAPEPEPTPVRPEPQPKVKPEVEQKPAAPVLQPKPIAPKPVAIAREEPAPKPLLPASKVSSSTVAEAARPARPLSAATLEAATAVSSGAGKKLVIFIVILFIVGAAAVFGVKWYFGQATQGVSDAVKAVTSPEGLQITNAAGSIDPGTQDLVITGSVENTTDKPRPAWYIVAEVYDAQNAVLTRAKMLSGKQIYTRHDYEILIRRGQNMQELKNKMQEQGVIIPPKGMVNFELRIMDPPAGIASFNATLQPFDPVQLFKEIAEDQKQR